MHIVYISREYGESLRGGGIARYIESIAEGMVQKGHEVTIITASDNTARSKNICNNNLNIIFLPGGDFYINQAEKKTFNFFRKFRIFYRFFSYRKKVLKELQKLNNVDLIEVQEYGAEGYYLRNIKTPIVVRLQTCSLLDRNTQKFKKIRVGTLQDWFTGFFENKIIREAKYITACSNALMDWTEVNVGINSIYKKVIFNPIQIKEEFNMTSLQKKEVVKIVYAGTVAKEKGIEELVRAIIMLKNRDINCKLFVAGKLGRYGEALKKDLYSRFKNEFQFLGHITANQLFKLYSSCHIACFPSWWEGMGLVCAEAMSSGPIVIGSNLGGMAEIIDDGINGFLISPKNVNELADTITKIINLNEKERLSISINARKKILNTFKISILTEETENFYHKILSFEDIKLQ